MTKKSSLQAEPRQADDASARSLRQSGYVPAVVYGGHQDNQTIKIKKLNLSKVYEQAGEASLVDLEIGSQAPVKVLIKDIQNDPIKGDIIHADLYQVNMNEPIEVELPFKFIGEPKAVKDLGGTLIKSMESVRIKCLPGDLVDDVEVDLGVLNEFGDAIKVGDLKLPENITIIDQLTETIASAIEPQAEEETAPVEAEVPAEGEEGKEKAAKEGEEPAAGKTDEKAKK